jgi:hypothetical protein
MSDRVPRAACWSVLMLRADARVRLRLDRGDDARVTQPRAAADLLDDLV